MRYNPNGQIKSWLIQIKSGKPTTEIDLGFTISIRILYFHYLSSKHSAEISNKCFIFLIIKFCYTFNNKLFNQFHSLRRKMIKTWDF